MINHQLIESGVLEACLLGIASEEDQQDVGQFIAANPDIAAYLHDLDTTLAAHFLHHSVPPPPAIRDVIELRVTEQALQKKERSAHADFNQQSTYSTTSTSPNYVDVEVDNTHIRVHKNWRPAFVAVFILSKVFLIASLYFYFKADSQAQEIARLKAEISHTGSK